MHATTVRAPGAVKPLLRADLRKSLTLGSQSLVGPLNDDRLLHRWERIALEVRS